MCLHIDICTNATCRLWPLPKTPLPSSFVPPTTKLGKASAHGSERARLAHKVSVLAAENPGNIQETPWQWIEDLINRLANNHEPVFDVDHDNFSGSNLYHFISNLIFNLIF